MPGLLTNPSNGSSPRVLVVAELERITVLGGLTSCLDVLGLFPDGSVTVVAGGGVMMTSSLLVTEACVSFPNGVAVEVEDAGIGSMLFGTDRPMWMVRP